MGGVSALIDIYKMTEVSVGERIRLLHALGEIVNYEINLLEEMDLLYAKIHRLEDICEQANIMLNQRDEIEEGLNKRIAELESETGRLQESWLWETVCPDGSLRPKVSELLLNLDGWKERSNGWESIVETLNARIAELEALVEQLIWVGNDLLIDNANPVTVVLFNGLVAKAKEKEREK